MITVVARVLRVLSGHSSTAMMHARDEHGHEHKLEIPAELSRRISPGAVLVMQWSVHSLPDVVLAEPTGAAPTPTSTPSSSRPESVSFPLATRPETAAPSPARQVVDNAAAPAGATVSGTLTDRSTADPAVAPAQGWLEALLRRAT